MQIMRKRTVNTQLLLMLKFTFLKGLYTNVENSEPHTILARIYLSSPALNPY